jgi:hypothetical protein
MLVFILPAFDLPIHFAILRRGLRDEEWVEVEMNSPAAKFVKR